MKILIALALVVGCGSERQSYKEVGPGQTPGGQFPGGQIPGQPESFASLKPVIDEQCALSGCHAGQRFLQTEAAFKASSSLQRITSGNMPRANRNSDLWTDEKKQRMISFLSN
jgi:hypothetical protein